MMLELVDPGPGLQRERERERDSAAPPRTHQTSGTNGDNETIKKLQSFEAPRKQLGDQLAHLQSTHNVTAHAHLLVNAHVT